jgi:hypothetical protein
MSPLRTRNVTIINAVPPVISLIGSAIVYAFSFEPYVDPGATVTDIVDTQIQSKLVVAGADVNTSVIGPHIITYRYA